MVLGPLSEWHGFIVIRICGCVASNLEGGFVVVDVNAFGHDFGTFGTEVRNTSTLHWTGVSSIFANGDNFDTGFEYFNNHIEVDVGLVVSPTGIKDIIHFDGVGLDNLFEVIFDSDDSGKAVLFTMAVDMSIAFDFVDCEGWASGDGDWLVSARGVDVYNVGDGGVTFDGHIFL